jgi:NAD(P)-dependent dehydrogenase (short-subunit alcohol dehydrogenase family)
MVEVVESKVNLVKNVGILNDRRDAPDVYDMNDAFNVWNHDSLFNDNCQFNANTKIFVMPRERSIDIDEEDDFSIAEFYINKHDFGGQIKTNLLENNLVIIAGGCGRIGKKFIETVLENKGIVIVGDLNEEEFNKIYSEFNSQHLFFKTLDITQKDSINLLIDYTVDKFGKIDSFVNTSYPKTKSLLCSMEKLDYDSFNESINMHLGGYYLCTQQLANYFMKQGYGNIVNLSSIQGVTLPRFDTYNGIVYNGIPMTSEVDYTCNKFGIIAMTRFMAKYYKNSNIRFNCISPGGIKDNQPEEFLERYQKYCLTKGMLDADDLKGALLFLISDLSKYVNGQNIIVDDGWTL